MNETATLAKYVANLRYEDIPEKVLERVRNTICDTIGAMIFGHSLPWSRMIVDYATTYGRGGKSCIFGAGAELVHPPMAALANGALAHAFELDGAAQPSAGAHPCATIFPAALAIAQERGFGGRDILTCFVAATEVLLRIGAATKKSNEHRGFHAPGTTGPFAAAVGAGKLLGFDESRLVNTIGIAASLSGGLVQFSRSGTGGMVKRLHFGRANESGVLAANLAERGFTGPHDILEGEFGFLRVFCDEYDIEKLTAGLGEKFMTMNIYMKRFACHGSCQAPLQALQTLQAKHMFSAADVERIDVYGSRDMVDRHNILEPKDRMLAQYSVPFAMALALFRDPRDPRSFDDSAIANKDILALGRRVRLIHEEGATASGASVTIILNDGHVLTERVTQILGTPALPPTRTDVYEKFAVLTRDHPRQKTDEIFERVQELEGEKNLDWLMV
ncbi:MAG TPA: MmgE/PrpD family protein [Beijerinckiaceae bacterium]|nr:MmgE/PrpD family protein [Beijerinckiaceae bacterium]